MAITTLDGVIAGVQPPKFVHKALTGTMVGGRPHSLFYTAGYPGAAVAPTPGLAGANLTSYAGQIPFTNPVSGNTHLMRFGGSSSAQQGMLLLCDRIWHNSGFTITSTAAQTINSASFIRDANGASLGDGIMLGVEVSGATGAGTPTLTVSYTNQAGTAGKTGTDVVATVASSIAGTFYPIGLAAGDTGVRSVQTLTLSATWTSGTIHLVAYRILAAVPINSVGYFLDATTGGLPRMYDNTVPFLIFVPYTTTTTSISAQMVVTQG